MFRVADAAGKVSNDGLCSGCSGSLGGTQSASGDPDREVRTYEHAELLARRRSRRWANRATRRWTCAGFGPDRVHPPELLIEEMRRTLAEHKPELVASWSICAAWPPDVSCDYVASVPVRRGSAVSRSSAGASPPGRDRGACSRSSATVPPSRSTATPGRSSTCCPRRCGRRAGGDLEQPFEAVH